ncbi:MAG TPA: hypothetical protein V6C57_04520 [Coleofasciculaceae cyanobacterium]
MSWIFELAIAPSLLTVAISRSWRSLLTAQSLVKPGGLQAQAGQSVSTFNSASDAFMHFNFLGDQSCLNFSAAKLHPSPCLPKSA